MIKYCIILILAILGSMSSTRGSEICENAKDWFIAGKSKEYCFLENSNEQIKDDKKSLKMNYDFQVMEKIDNSIHIKPKHNIMLPESVEKLSIDIYDTASHHRLYFLCQDSENKYAIYSWLNSSRSFRTLNHKGWKSYSFDPVKDRSSVWGGKGKKLKFPLKLVSIMLDPIDKNRLSGAIYFSELRLTGKNGQVEFPSSPPQSIPFPMVSKKTEAAAKMVMKSKLRGNLSWDGEKSQIEFILKTNDDDFGACNEVVDILDRDGNQLHHDQRTIQALSNKNISKVVDIPSKINGFYQIRYRLYRNKSCVFEFITTGGAFRTVSIDDSYNFPLGVGYWNWKEDQELICSILNKMGVRWLRTDAVWPYIEKERGKLNWEPTDIMFKAAAKNKLNLLVTTQYIPKWAAQTPYHQYGENPVPKEWHRFLKNLIERYGKYISCYEVWNEPDTPYHWTGGAETYLQHLKRSHDTIRKFAPKSLIALGGITGHERNWRPFVTELLKLGGGEYFDIYSYHYGWEKLGSVHQALMNRFNINKPMWNTEAGFGDPDKLILNVIQDMIAGVKKSFYFDFQSSGDHYGNIYMLKPDLTPRISMLMYMTLAAKLNLATPEKEVDFGSEYQAYKLKGKTKESLIFRTTKLKCGIALKTTDHKIIFTDVAGKKRILVPFNGWFGVPADETAYLDMNVIDKPVIAKPIFKFSSKCKIIAGKENKIMVTMYNPDNKDWNIPVEFYAPRNWKISSPTQDVNLKAGEERKLYFYLLPDISTSGDSFRCEIAIKNSNHQAAFQTLRGKVLDPLEIELKPEISNGIAKVKIIARNLLDKQISSKIKLFFPASWKSNTTHNFKIPPLHTTELVVPISWPLLKNQKNSKQYNIFFEKELFGVSKRSMVVMNWIGIPQVSNNPVWNKLPTAVTLNQRKNYISDSKILETWTGPQDLSVKFQWGWTTDTLKFHWEVTDNVHNNNCGKDKLWSRDSIQIWYDGVLIDLACVNGKSVIYPRPQKTDISRLKLRVKRINKKTVYDLTILPKTKHKFRLGDCFSFGFCVNDNDGEPIRKGWMYYYSKVGNDEERKKSPTITLMK